MSELKRTCVVILGDHVAVHLTLPEGVREHFCKNKKMNRCKLSVGRRVECPRQRKQHGIPFRSEFRNHKER